jgi:monothiol glutaredoxin
MQRPILPLSNIHPAIQNTVATSRQRLVTQVQTAIAAHPVVVVGMGMNPLCGKARKALDSAGVAHHYLEYGNYFNMWRDRNALKMWTGWPTFPMVFVRGTLVGGANDVTKLIASGELKTMLTA